MRCSGAISGNIVQHLSGLGTPLSGLASATRCLRCDTLPPEPLPSIFTSPLSRNTWSSPETGNNLHAEAQALLARARPACALRLCWIFNIPCL